MKLVLLTAVTQQVVVQ